MAWTFGRLSPLQPRGFQVPCGLFPGCSGSVSTRFSTFRALRAGTGRGGEEQLRQSHPPISGIFQEENIERCGSSGLKCCSFPNLSAQAKQLHSFQKPSCSLTHHHIMHGEPPPAVTVNGVPNERRKSGCPAISTRWMGLNTPTCDSWPSFLRVFAVFFRARQGALKRNHRADLPKLHAALRRLCELQLPGILQWYHRHLQGFQR